MTIDGMSFTEKNRVAVGSGRSAFVYDLAKKEIVAKFDDDKRNGTLIGRQQLIAFKTKDKKVKLFDLEKDSKKH